MFIRSFPGDAYPKVCVHCELGVRDTVGKLVFGDSLKSRTTQYSCNMVIESVGTVEKPVWKKKKCGREVEGEFEGSGSLGELQGELTRCRLLGQVPHRLFS